MILSRGPDGAQVAPVIPITAPPHAGTPTLQAVPQRPRSRYDEVVVELRLAGQRDVWVSCAERERIVLELRGQGLTDPAIHRRTGIPARTVLRIRQRLGLAAVPRYLTGIKRVRRTAA